MTTHHKNYTEEELGYPTEAHGRIPSFCQSGKRKPPSGIPITSPNLSARRGR